LGAALYEGSPILAEARQRPIAPLPPGGLQHGIFKPLTLKDLSYPPSMVKWHRRQLGSAAPVMGATEADLLLTLATALYATSLEAADVKGTRVGMFAFTLTRRIWERSVPFVPEAGVLLGKVIRDLGAAWAGLTVETAQADESRDEVRA
jgi:hypothetical protein